MSLRNMRGGLDVQLLTADERLVPVEISLSAVELQGESRVLATIVDISRRKEAERTLRQAHQLTQSIIDNSPFSIAATDTDGTIIAASPALEKLTGYSREELIGSGYASLLISPDDLKRYTEQFSNELGIALKPNFQPLVIKASRGNIEGQEWTYVRKDASVIPVNQTVTPLRSNDEDITGYMLIAYDISEEKRAREQIEHVAYHDMLTGLPNRRLMEDRLHSSLLRMKRYKSLVAVIILDLDHFKRINDTLGHFAGDQLLKAVADRLKQSVRKSDTVCRMGGDEFVAILPDISKIDDVIDVCKKIKRNLSRPIPIGLQHINVTPSIGVSIAPEHGDTTELLLKNADTALYQTKEAGRNGFTLFSPRLERNDVDPLDLESQFREAFKNNQTELYYQPLINLATREILGFEALLRWQSDNNEPVPPDIYIPLAEATGLIIPVGAWILDRACADLARLQKTTNKEFCMSINISVSQFEHSDFLDTVQTAIEKHDVVPASIQLEVTESLLIAQSDVIRHKLEKLHHFGVRLILDNYGESFSNLSTIATLPFDAIKISRSFMAPDQPAGVAVLSAMSAMSNKLNLKLIAKGIETHEHLNFAKEWQCQEGQGFLFAKAMPLAQITSLVFSKDGGE